MAISAPYIRIVQVGVVLIGCLLIESPARAQLFGDRTVGQPLRGRQQQPGAPQLGTAPGGQNVGGNQGEVGILSGNERFLRGNRSRNDFVGSNRASQSGFVGSQQAIATGRVRSATETLDLQTADEGRINRPMPPQPATGLYYPKLDLDFGLPRSSSDLQGRREQAIDRGHPSLQRRVRRIAGEAARVEMNGRTATLIGTANSQRAAELAAQIMEFEPGVDAVDNQLVISRSPVPAER